VPSPSAAPEVGVPSPASSNRRRQPAKKRSENAVQATASSSEQSQPTQSSEAQVATAAASSRKSQKPVKKEKRPAAPAPVEAVSAAAQPEDSTLPLDNRRRQAPPKGQRPPKAQRQPNSAVSAESVPASATAAGGAADATPVVPAASASNAKTANPSKSRARQRRSASPHSDISHVTNSTTTTTSSKGGKHEKLSGSQMESLQLQLSKGTYICAICTEFVKPQHAIWSCLRCSHALHLSCAEKWAQSCNKAQAADPSSVDVVASMLQGSMFSLSRSSRPATSSGGISMNGPTQSKSSSDDALWWRCPTCSFEMVEKPKYICFCGKVLFPIISYFVFHSFFFNNVVGSI
jgi:rubrerythrin